MLPLFCCLFVLLGQSLASPSANQYVDSVIYSSLQNVIRNERMEPTHLADYSFDYKDKIMFTTVNGKANYTEGKLSGLSKVQRYSECDGPRNISGSTVINCTLTFNNLSTSYKGKVKYGVVPKVSIDAKGNVHNVIFTVGISKRLNEWNARVNSLTFRSYGTISTNFSGLGPLNNHMKVLEKNYRERVGAEVISVIGNRFQYAMNLAVASVPMPLR